MGEEIQKHTVRTGSSIIIVELESAKGAKVGKVGAEMEGEAVIMEVAREEWV